MSQTKKKPFKEKLRMLDDLDMKGSVKENPDHCTKQCEFLALVFITEGIIHSNHAILEKSLKNYFQLNHE